MAEEEENLKAVDISGKCRPLLEEAIGKEVDGIVGVRKEEDKWKATADVVEREAVPDAQDLIGRYQVTLDEDGELVSYNQISIRRRADRKGIEEEFPAP